MMAGVCIRLDRDVFDFVVGKQVAVDMVAVMVDVGAHEEPGRCSVLHWFGWKLCCGCASS
jgi:hypothetical protein